MRTEVECGICGTRFLKENKAINRTQKTNGIHCCSRKCVGENSKNKNRIPMAYNLRNSKRVAKQKNLDNNLTVEYLQELFELQKGLCAISNVKMTLVFKHNEKTIEQVSIDRIDDSKGYVIGNVQLVALGINYMRNTFTVRETVDFIKKL